MNYLYRKFRKSYYNSKNDVRQTNSSLIIFLFYISFLLTNVNDSINGKNYEKKETYQTLR